MHIVRYESSGRATPGLQRGDGSIAALPVESLGALLALPLADIKPMVEAAAAADATPGVTKLLPPVDGRTEVWAAGVTYRRSQQARMEESDVADVYWRVYDAQRPELFFKSAAWRVVGPGDPIGIRLDSPVNVPEPELALVINAHAEVVGLTVCNDVSSRSIEGENPLYLPQAKVYAGSCAVGPGVRPIWEVTDPADLAIAVEVTRAGSPVWAAETRTSAMHRTFADLIEHLFRADTFPEGVVLSTGTGVVPELDFTLEPADTVTITVEQVGALSNSVVAGPAAFSWLAAAGSTTEHA